MDSAEWYKRFSIITQFYNKKCHLSIPVTAVTAGGINIGEWLEYQRTHSNELSASQISDLCNFGMIWTKERGTFHREFDKYAAELKKYSKVDVNTFAHTARKLVIPEGAKAKDGFDLYKWSLTFEKLKNMNDDRYMTIAEAMYLKSLGVIWQSTQLGRTSDESLHRATSLAAMKGFDASVSDSEDKWLKENVKHTKKEPVVKKAIKAVKNVDVGKIEKLNKLVEKLVQHEEKLGAELKVLNAYCDYLDVKNTDSGIVGLTDNIRDISKEIRELILEIKGVETKVEIKTEDSLEATVKSDETDTKNKENASKDKGDETDDLQFKLRCNTLYKLVNKVAKSEGMNREDVQLTAQHFTKYVGSLNVYRWLGKVRTDRHSLNEERLDSLHTAYPMWIESVNLKCPQSFVDSYIAEATRQLEKSGYIDMVDSKLSADINRMRSFNKNDFDKEQIEALDKVDYIWLRDSKHTVRWATMAEFNAIMESIHSNNYTDLSGTKYNAWYGRCKKSALGGHLVYMRLQEIIDRNLERNKHNL